MKKRIVYFLFVLFYCVSVYPKTNNIIDLSGVWRFQLDPMGFGKTPGSELYLSKLTENIYLPGTTDEGGKGIQNFVAHVDRLSRKFEYCGQAWYQREVEIPDSWKGKEVVLSLERCHWETSVYIDGVLCGIDERLSTPNRFVVTKHMLPGVHTMTICVDNRLKYPMDQWNHGTTEYTQTNWNGMVGDIKLEAYHEFAIQNIRVDTDTDKKLVSVKMNTFRATEKEVGLSLCIKDRQGEIVGKLSDTVTPGDSLLSYELPLKAKISLWDEFDPYLYTLEVSVSSGKDVYSKNVAFGFRKVEQGEHHIRLNDRNIHLRGVLDCAVFPKTGYPATDVESWLKIFSTIKSYGMNHVRFHSWCPPEAAFCASDKLGLYIQAELPMWIKDVGKYPSRRDFFENEMYAILKEYGNHPSFILMCNGNENEGDFSVLEDLVKKAQVFDNRRLYSASTARTHVKSDQYYVSHVTSKGWITVYEGKPSTDWDRAVESDIDVPIIAHETGQRCMFPNFEEMKKYTGVLVPRNFQVFKDRLAANGLLHKADDFFKATGAHTVLQYKEVNESLLRTHNSGGFQLLGLADFPGQGSAFVGILDAFWESKGLVEPEKFRESCSPVVLLARMPKRTYLNNESLNVKLEIYQFGKKNIRKGYVNWKLVDEKQKTIERGKLKHGELKTGGVASLGVVELDLQSIDKAGKYTLMADLDNAAKNEWDIWVYPHETGSYKEYSCVRNWDEAKNKLMNGEKVLFIPENVKGRKTRFASHFWNPIMFNWNPMIVGTWIDCSHPAFKEFPTSYYADWQWWDILNYCVAVDLTECRDIEPLIQSIDTYEVNRKLGIAFEAKVGKGSLFVFNVDINKDIDNRIAVKQLLKSVNNYVTSESFVPQTEVPLYKLDNVFSTSDVSNTEDKSNAAVIQLLNK